MRMPTTALFWWDREVEGAGRPIRVDVRLAGHEIWEQVCQRPPFSWITSLGPNCWCIRLARSPVKNTSRRHEHMLLLAPVNQTK
jgi:hypothetical protein